MKQLPDPKTYEKEFKYFPWGALTVRVKKLIRKEVPDKGYLVDLACGPGYLLGEIHEIRPDLKMTGVDIDARYIGHAKKKYSGIQFIEADILEWQPSDQFDAVIVTAGLHHLPYDKQSGFLKKIADMLKPNGMAILADPYVDDFANEHERKMAASKLGYEYLLATIERGGPNDILQAAIDILSNDVMGDEYKTSIKKITPMLHEVFEDVTITKTWPDKESEYGDYIIVARK